MTTFVEELKSLRSIGQIEEKFARFRSYEEPPRKDLYHSVITYVKNQKDGLMRLAEEEGKSLDDLLIIDDKKVSFEDWVEKSVLSIEQRNDYTVFGRGTSFNYHYQNQPVQVKGEPDFPAIRYLDNLLIEMAEQFAQAYKAPKTKKALQHLQKGLYALGHLAQIEKAAIPGCVGLTNLYAFI
jgi:hypothetical protein